MLVGRQVAAIEIRLVGGRGKERVKEILPKSYTRVRRLYLVPIFPKILHMREFK